MDVWWKAAKSFLKSMAQWPKMGGSLEELICSQADYYIKFLYTVPVTL